MKRRRGEGATRRKAGTAAQPRDNEPALRDEAQAPTSQPLLYPADKVVIAYFVIIAALIVAFSFRIPAWPQLIAAHALIVATVLLLAKWDQTASRRAAAFSRLIHGWYPVGLITISFKELTYLIPLIHPRDFDASLAAIDYRLFGAHPTVWLERLTFPAITEVLQVVYATYYILPIILGGLLWRKGWFEQYKFWVFIVVLGFYVSYFGYIAVPATGPRFLPAVKDAQSLPLTGVWLFTSLRETLDRMEGITRDCFPSGHTELTLLVLYYARRFHRRLFWLLLPVGSALIFSTVYLRYHYVIDVIAGAATAGFVIFIAKPLYRLLSPEPGVPSPTPGP